MRSRYIGNLAIVVLAATYPVLWIATFQGPRTSIYPPPELIAEMLAGTAMLKDF